MIHRFKLIWIVIGRLSIGPSPSPSLSLSLRFQRQPPIYRNYYVYLSYSLNSTHEEQPASIRFLPSNNFVHRHASIITLEGGDPLCQTRFSLSGFERIFESILLIVRDSLSMIKVTEKRRKEKNKINSLSFNGVFAFFFRRGREEREGEIARGERDG